LFNLQHCYLQSEEMNLGIKCWKHNITTSNAWDLRVIITAVHIVVVVKAPREKKKTKWILDYHWIWWKYEICSLFNNNVFSLIFKKQSHHLWPNFGYWCFFLKKLMDIFNVSSKTTNNPCFYYFPLCAQDHLTQSWEGNCS
jgi:hypothetical protein